MSFSGKALILIMYIAAADEFEVPSTEEQLWHVYVCIYKHFKHDYNVL